MGRVTQIKDIIKEFMAGFLREGLICDQLKDLDNEITRTYVQNILEKKSKVQLNLNG